MNAYAIATKNKTLNMQFRNAQSSHNFGAE